MFGVKWSASRDGLGIGLQIDLYDYCMAILRWYQAKEEKIPEAVQEADIQLKSYRAELIESLIYINGALLWSTAQELLIKKCRMYPESSPPHTLYEYYLHSQKNNRPLPLAFESLKRYFIELFKNSIDALIDHYLKSQQQSLLKMQIELSFEKEQLNVIITDNAGGFSSAYLDEFYAFKLSIEQPYSPFENRSKKNEGLVYQLGGNGLGIRGLVAFIKRGIEIGREDSQIKRFAIDGSTDVALSNTKEGAQIKVSSPLKPFNEVDIPVSPSEVDNLLSSKVSLSPLFPSAGGVSKNSRPQTGLLQRRLTKRCLFGPEGNEKGSPASTQMSAYGM